MAPTGTLAVASTDGGTVTLTATYQGVPGKSHAEVALRGDNYLNVQAAPDAQDADSPWTVTFSNVPVGDYNAALFFYTWKGHSETGTVDLDSEMLTV